MFSDELVRRSLAASKRANEMKEEIVAIVGMVFGFLNKEDLNLFHNGDKKWNITLFQHLSPPPKLCWELCKDGDNLHLKIYTLGKPSNPVIWTYGIGRSPIGESRREVNSLSLEYLRSVHECLPGFLRSMIYFFPRLAEEIVLLFETAGIESPDADGIIRSLREESEQ